MKQKSCFSPIYFNVKNTFMIFLQISIFNLYKIDPISNDLNYVISTPPPPPERTYAISRLESYF